MAMIFDNYLRTEVGYRKETDSAFDFLNKSAWLVCGYLREKISEWAKPFATDRELINRLKSKDDRQHNSAIFELLCYTILSNYKLKIHKNNPLSVSKKPDFTIKLPKNKSLFIECTLAGHSYETEEEKKRKQDFTVIIDGIHHFPYYINFTIEKTAAGSISRKKLLLFLNSFAEECNAISNNELFHKRKIFSDNGWSVSVFLLRKPNSSIKSSLGMHGGGNAKKILTQKPIYTALNKKKPSRYLISSEPYVIAVSISDLFADEHSFCDALFGPNLVDTINLNFKLGSGLYFNNLSPVNTTVSAVIFFKDFSLYSLNDANITVWHNPFAKNPIANNLLPFNEYIYLHESDDILKRKSLHKKTSILELLNIDRVLYKNLLLKLGT